MIKITNIGSASISIVSWSGSRLSLSSQESILLDEPYGGQVMSYYRRLSFSAPIKIEAPVKRVEEVSVVDEVKVSEPVVEASVDNVIEGSSDNVIDSEVVNEVSNEESVVNADEVVASDFSDDILETADIDQEPVVDLSSFTVKQLYQYADDNDITLEKGLSKKQILKILNA